MYSRYFEPELSINLLSRGTADIIPVFISQCVTVPVGIKLAEKRGTPGRGEKKREGRLGGEGISG